MTIMCMLASAVWGGSSSSAAICSNVLAVLRSSTSAVVTASDRASHNPRARAAAREEADGDRDPAGGARGRKKSALLGGYRGSPHQRSNSAKDRIRVLANAAKRLRSTLRGAPKSASFAVTNTARPARTLA